MMLAPSRQRQPKLTAYFIELRSKTPLQGYSVFVSYESSMRKAEIKPPRVPISNAS